jgi:hypothetical protein
METQKMSDNSITTILNSFEPPPTPPARKSRQRKERPQDRAQQYTGEVSLQDFHAYMPTHSYLFHHTLEFWPAASVNGRIQPWPVNLAGKKVKPSDWLDANRPIEQVVWDPAQPQIILGRVMQVCGYAQHDGSAVFNLYRPPEFAMGDAAQAGPWREHLQRIYPQDAEHIERYFAHLVQHPGSKPNHALVLGGAPGIGKDTLIEPVKVAVGRWNCQTISPPQMQGRFNGFVKCVLLVVSEARDLGEFDRYSFYEHSKQYLAAPPDVIRVDEKNIREHYVANVCGVVITTNHKTDGLYLPADDRRHYVAWSEVSREQFPEDYWRSLYGWYANGGTGHVIAHLMQMDLSSFDAKAPPRKTAAFWSMVQAGEAPESGELRDVIDELHNPAALTLNCLIGGADSLHLYDLIGELKDRKFRRAMPHKLDRVGYVPVRNPDAEDGMFKIAGRRQAVYARKQLSFAEQIKAARQVSPVR